VSCDAVAANKAFHEKFDFAFPLLSDVDKSMTKSFGVCKPAKDGSDPCDTVWKSTSVSGAPDNSALWHFSPAVTHRLAIEQASRRWRAGRRDDSAERAVKF
jgi:hypothetical protein